MNGWKRKSLKARRTGNTFAVIMLDVDGFKSVNDTYGHAVGDQVLRAIFNFLATGLRSTDFLARYGGDELTLILSQSDPPSAVVVVQKILEKVTQFSFEAARAARSSTWGSPAGSPCFPVHANTAANLLRAADEALYRAKKQQRGWYLTARGFTGELHSRINPTHDLQLSSFLIAASRPSMRPRRIPMPRKVKIILNPMADMGNAWKIANDLRPIISEYGNADWSGTVYPTHATELAKQAGEQGYERVIAMGGDGTVHEVVNGIMQLPGRTQAGPGRRAGRLGQ